MQTELLEGLAANFATNEYRLLVIDSVMSLYRTDFSGRGELSERQQVLGQFLRRATSMAEEFNLVVLMVSPYFVSSHWPCWCFKTNQVMSDPGASALFAGVDGRKPAGGHVLAHASTTRLLLRKGRGEERVAKIVDSPGEWRIDSQVVWRHLPAFLTFPNHSCAFPCSESLALLESLNSAFSSSPQVLLPELIFHNANLHLADCPEREATYIITTGGINDPEKA
jgi:hypothetical protein